MKVNTLLATGTTLIGSAVAFGGNRLSVFGQAGSQAATTAIPPSQDPWYTAPFGYELTLPGTILRIRTAPNTTVSTVANSSAAYNILYRSTNSQNGPTFAVTTLFVPLNPDPTKLVSYQIPYDSAYINASPSYTFNFQGEGDISTLLGKGWYVSSPDYEGPLASFTAGVNSGYATLDSVKAVLSAGKGPSIFKGTKYAMWGYSGGALASEWATELQGRYAPGLKFAGAALGGLTPNVTSVLFTCDGTIYAGLIPSGILGLASQFPNLQSYLNSTLKTSGPQNITGFYAAKHLDLYGSIAMYAGQKIEDYFTNGISTLNSPQAQQVIASDGIMGTHGQPKFPLFVYKAIGDDVSVIADTDKLINQYCAASPQPTIKYDRNTVGNHLTEEYNGVGRSLDFLSSVLSDQVPAAGCHIQNVTVTA